jgi:hypothetical protein
MTSETDIAMTTSAVREAAEDEVLAKMRIALAKFTADTFTQVADELHAIGHIFGPDRVNGHSPGGHGSDEIVLLRQMVEIEYLAWAFETRDKDAERWLRSTREERESFFKPCKLRQVSNGKFRGKDYGYHCELGGHPVPRSFVLLKKDIAIGQLLLSDLLGHTGRIWDHVLDWAAGDSWAAPIIVRRREEMWRKYTEWKHADNLTNLPPPP